jgi:hypothetical protein
MVREGKKFNKKFGCENIAWKPFSSVMLEDALIVILAWEFHRVHL